MKCRASQARWIPILLLAVSLAPRPAGAAVAVDEMLMDALDRVPATLDAVPAGLTRLAVYAIEPDAGGAVNVTSVADQLVAILLRANRFQVVDRKMLKVLLEEQALSLTGVVDEAAMVKAGRLIGVQGFFYGAVDVREDRLVLTLKLVAVETGAIVFAREFTGEAASRSRIGLGWAATSVPAAVAWRASAIQHASPDEFPLGADTPGETRLLSPMGGVVSWRQGVRGTRWARLGADLSVSYVMADAKTDFDLPEGKATFNGETSRWGGYTGFDALRIGVRPRLMFSPKALLNWKSDWLVPYAGLAVEYWWFMLWYGVHRTVEAPTFRDAGNLESVGSASAVAFAPVLGVEAGLTRALSVFLEAQWIVADASGGEASSEPLNEIFIRTTPVIPAGIQINAGLVWSIDLGGGGK